MGGQLRDRLKRIKLAKAETNVPPGAPGAPPVLKEFPGWEYAGHKTLRRIVFLSESGGSFNNAESFPPSLAILVPDLFRYGAGQDYRSLAPRNLVFFDLETTGLGGAGTVAFLAAFGRFKESGFEITQYLLLDFPGEYDFIEAVVKEFSNEALPHPALIVSYNGKTFDSQIIKTRCLMNGVRPPEYYHADILHPCRRIWKRILPDCSQSTIETEILGLDRTGDIPGSLAPDIWFSFLKTGETGDLFGICDHNIKDVSGLMKVFFALAKIAAEPLEARKKFRTDTEALALRWREVLRIRPGVFDEKETLTAASLMKAAAKENSLKVLRILAIEAEWKEGNYSKALKYAERILSLKGIPPGLHEETLRRRERLLRKMSG